MSRDTIPGPGCPHNPAILELVQEARTASKNLGVLAEHLETCPLCIAQLETLLAPRLLRETLHTQRQRPAPPTPPPVERLIDRLMGPALGAATIERVPASVTLDFLAPAQEPGELGWLGPFRIRSVLGQGGMGVVLAAEDPHLGRPLALKVLPPSMSRLPEARERFLREARALAAIQHPHVVAVHQVGQVEDIAFLAMERLEGETLEQRLQSGQPLDLADILQLGREAAQGLAAAHARGLVHRDLKPANLFLARPPLGDPSAFTVKILDFGLARPLTGASLTESGLFVGTPAYAAPEQLEDGTVDHRADLFALGAVLYRLVAGRPAFAGDRVLAVVRSLALDQPPLLHSVNPQTPPALSTLVGQLLAKDPVARPGSALEVAEHLRDMSKEPERAGSVSDGTEPSLTLPARSRGERPAARRLPPRSWRLKAILLTAAAAVLLVVGTLLLRSSHGTVEIECDDPDVKVLVEDRGGRLTVLDLKSQKTLRLTPGPLRLHLWPGKDLSLETDSFVLKRGDRVLVRVKQGEWQSQQWLRQVSGLPAGKLVEAVQERLRQRNPGFAGPLQPTTRDGKVVRLAFCSDQVLDLSPVRALVDLEVLACGGSGPGASRLRDLKPLAGLNLVKLDIHDTQVEDLAPLRGMPLAVLLCPNTRVSDLGPLTGMKMETLRLQGTRVNDLKPLEGMPLYDLSVAETHVRDLTFLRGMHTLRVLDVSGVPVTTLEPLRGIPIVTLDCSWTAVKNLEPFRSILNRLSMQATPVRELAVLGSLKNLAALEVDADHPDLVRLRTLPNLHINLKPAEQFWKEVGSAAPDTPR